MLVEHRLGEVAQNCTAEAMVLPPLKAGDGEATEPEKRAGCRRNPGRPVPPQSSVGTALGASAADHQQRQSGGEGSHGSRRYSGRTREGSHDPGRIQPGGKGELIYLKRKLSGW